MYLKFFEKNQVIQCLTICKTVFSCVKKYVFFYGSVKTLNELYLFQGLTQ